MQHFSKIFSGNNQRNVLVILLYHAKIFSFHSICTNGVLILILGVIYKTFQGKMRVTSRKLPQTEVCLSA